MFICEVTKPYAHKKLLASLKSMEPEIVGQRLDKYKLTSIIQDTLDQFKVEVEFQNTPNVPKDEINMNAGYSQGIDAWNGFLSKAAFTYSTLEWFKTLMNGMV